MTDVLIGATGKTLVTQDGQTVFRFQGEAPPISYLFNEDFEGAGTPSGWFGSGVDFDSTVSPLQGSQSLRCPSGGNFALYPSGADLNIPEAWFKFTVRFSALPASFSEFLKILAPGFSPTVATLVLLSDGKIRVTDGGGGTISQTTVSSISSGAAYDVSLHYRAGSGSNGVASVGFVIQGGLIPTSGNAFAGASNSPNTANIGGYQIFGEGDVPNTDYDVVQGATVFIP